MHNTWNLLDLNHIVNRPGKFMIFQFRRILFGLWYVPKMSELQTDQKCWSFHLLSLQFKFFLISKGLVLQAQLIWVMSQWIAMVLHSVHSVSSITWSLATSRRVQEDFLVWLVNRFSQPPHFQFLKVFPWILTEFKALRCMTVVLSGVTEENIFCSAFQAFLLC